MSLTELAAIAAFVTALVALGGVVRFWMKLGTQLSDAEEAKKLAQTSQSAFSAYQTFAMGLFATKNELERLENRHNSQFDTLREDIRGIYDRLDRILEMRGEKK